MSSSFVVGLIPTLDDAVEKDVFAYLVCFGVGVRSFTRTFSSKFTDLLTFDALRFVAERFSMFPLLFTRGVFNALLT